MSLFNKLFGGSQERSKSLMSLDQAREIAGAYGEVLERHAPVPGTVADASKLPYPKPVIKQALIVLLQSNVNTQMKEHLKTAYILLADWQEGVGDTNRGLDLTNVDPKADPRKLAEHVLSQQKDFARWSAKVREENQQLKAELQRLGLW